MIAHVSHLGKSNTASTTNWSVFALATSVAIFCGLQAAIWRVNGLWLDELFSLWATDPSTPFAGDFVHRIAPDETPPGYYCLLYVMRLFVNHGRISAIALNALILIAAAVITYFSARRARLVPLALLCFSVFLLSGPVVYYTSEARAYLEAMAVAFVASWLVALQVTQPNRQQSLVGFVSLGVLAALVHLYAAIYCCSLAAGLLIIGTTRPGHRSLLQSGVALGASAAVVCGLWLLIIRNSLRGAEWIQFNAHEVHDAIFSVLSLNGAPILYVIIIAFALIPLVFGGRKDDAYSLFIVFSVTYLLFFTVPILVSFKKPIICDRYWLIGSPGIIIFAGFQMRSLYLNSVSGNAVFRYRSALYAISALTVFWINLGVTNAYQRFAYKMVWRGADEVKALMVGCPNQSIHVGAGFKDEDGKLSFELHGAPFFSLLTGQPADKLVPIVGAEGSWLALRDAKCPVVGWAEHLNADKLKTLSNGELLHLLKIEASNADVDIRRHNNGFVVLRRAN